MTTSGPIRTALIPDDLRSAASIPLPKDITTTHLIRSSPYFDEEHALDLKTLPQNYQILALALEGLQAHRDYANLPYEEAFNLKEVLSLIRHYSEQLGYDFPDTEAYVIAFRSVLKPEVQTSVEKRKFLAKVDKLSHQEANSSGGLLKYWFGVPNDSEAKNLATCLWVDRSHAKRGGGGKVHREGMRKVASWYKYWKVEEYTLRVSVKGKDLALVRI